MGAIRANNFPRQANGYGQVGGDHASSQIDPDNTERCTGIYGSGGQASSHKGPAVPAACPSAGSTMVIHGHSRRNRQGT